MKTVFIYALCEPGTRTVRYIGLTRDMARRFRQHMNESKRKRSYLGSWLRSLLGALPVMVELSNVPESEGAGEEIRFITAARVLGINLVNLTDGGQGGCNPSPETRSKRSVAMKAVWKTPGFVEKMKSVLTPAQNRPEVVAKKSSGMRDAWSDPKKSSAMSAHNDSIGYKATQGKQSKKSWGDPEVRARRLAGMANSEVRARIGATTRKSWADPEARARRLAAQQVGRHTPEAKAKRRAGQLNRWAKYRKNKGAKY